MKGSRLQRAEDNRRAAKGEAFFFEDPGSFLLQVLIRFPRPMSGEGRVRVLRAARLSVAPDSLSFHRIDSFPPTGVQRTNPRAQALSLRKGIPHPRILIHRPNGKSLST
jgi:hypothetical protein